MSDNGNRRLQYLVIAIVALVLVTILLHYAHSQEATNVLTKISECEQIRIENFELKREIIRVKYELFLASNNQIKQLQEQNTETIKLTSEFINSLYEQYKIDKTKFELRDGKFQALKEKTQ